MTEYKPYTFSTGLDSNLGAFTDEIRQSAAEQPADTSNLFDTPTASVDAPADIPQDDPNIPADFMEGTEEDEENETRHLGKGVAESGGKALARAVDRVASVALALIAKGDAKDYRADRTEMADLQQAFADFMLETGFRMSPSANLMVALMSIYGFKAMGALQDRKVNEQKVIRNTE